MQLLVAACFACLLVVPVYITELTKSEWQGQISLNPKDQSFTPKTRSTSSQERRIKEISFASSENESIKVIVRVYDSTSNNSRILNEGNTKFELHTDWYKTLANIFGVYPDDIVDVYFNQSIQLQISVNTSGILNLKLIQRNSENFTIFDDVVINEPRELTTRKFRALPPSDKGYFQVNFVESNGGTIELKIPFELTKRISKINLK